MKRVAVTGAAGFLGGAVLTALADGAGDVTVRAIDRTAPTVPDSRFVAVAGDLRDAGTVADLLRDVDIVIHLAALPGGASEADPAASRSINLDVPLTLIERLARSGGVRRLVFAGSIAVFGTPLPDRIDDETMPLPALTYGAHKLMAEIALADATRRGAVDGVALRLPGLVARPGAGTGLRSAFLTEVFHAARDGRDYAVPVSRDATVWIMSARTAAANVVHAALHPTPRGDRAAMTLPAVRTSMGELVERIVARTATPAAITFSPDAATEAQFGALPPLDARRALAAGYRADDSLDALVATVIADLDHAKERTR
ncbi:MAG TPA: NAD-dependent epimerase/dehydratase family protein [Sphingomonas sp.]|nr:NAD-dependent epimerase/dehydratase family protein [Sphingomonas sp.]